MNCNNCGEAIFEEDRVCTSCGNVLRMDEIELSAYEKYAIERSQMKFFKRHKSQFYMWTVPAVATAVISIFAPVLLFAIPFYYLVWYNCAKNRDSSESRQLKEVEVKKLNYIEQQNQLQEDIVWRRYYASLSNDDKLIALKERELVVREREFENNKQMQMQSMALQQQQISIQQQQHNSQAKCPRCGSTSLSGSKQGFGVGKAAVGYALVGPIGAVAGGIHSNRTWITCMKCGHKYRT